MKKKEITINRIRKSQKLLRQFGVKAYAFDSGIKGYIIEVPDRQGYRSYIDFDESTWEWVELLLKELLKWRKYGKSFGMDFSERIIERNKHGMV